MSAVVNVLQCYNWKICKFIFESSSFSSCAQSVSLHTHTHTVLNLITACTGGGVCFSSSRDEVEGGMEGTARSRLSLYLHEQRASINSTTPPPQVLIATAIRLCAMKTLWCKWSRGPRSLGVVQPTLEWLRSRRSYTLDVILALPWHESTRARLLLPQASKQKWLKMKGSELKHLS